MLVQSESRKQPDSDINNPRGMMSPDYSLGYYRSERDFAFAFNNNLFSDRVLRIEVMAGPWESRTEAELCLSIADWDRNRKRRREEAKKGHELASKGNHSDARDAVVCENQDDLPVPMVEETSSDDGTIISSDLSWGMDCTPILRVKTLHISSPILAAKSPFFYKLFSNGMWESEQRHISLRINASEEDAVMELLNFMYRETLTVTTAPALLDVLMAADKFEVASCMRYCSRLLSNLPMNSESALLYLELPSSVLMAEAVQPLTDAAKHYLATRYKDMARSQEELLSLPIAGIEAILSSDELEVASEDTVFDFVVKWARAHYPKIEERREILTSRLGSLIRFCYMSTRKLKKVLNFNDFDNEFATKAVLEALFFKLETPQRQKALSIDEATSNHYVDRAYRYRPVRVVDFDLPHLQSIVYLDLKREECANLFPSGRFYSQIFFLGGQGFFLSAHCNMDQQSCFHCFGLFLGMQEKGEVSFAVDYEFAARTKVSGDFVSKYKGSYTFTGGKAVGYRNLFGISWRSFMAEDSLYFVNGILHLRAELTVRQPAQTMHP